MLLEGIAGQEIQHGHQACQLKQAAQKGDVVDGAKGCSGELERHSGKKGNAQQAGRRNQISEGIELGGAKSLEELVEKLEGQAQQLPGRIPSSPIPSSPVALTDHQGRRLGGPNLHGGTRFRGRHFSPGEFRVVEHLGFHFWHRREIARLVLGHGFLTGLLVLRRVVIRRNLVILIG